MPVITRTSIKSIFKAGAFPTSANFSDWISSMERVSPAGSAVVQMNSGAATGGGLIEIISSASSTTQSLGAFGQTFIAATTSAAGAALLDDSFASAGAFGLTFISAATTAAGQSLLNVFGSASPVGAILVSAATTAAQQDLLNITAFTASAATTTGTTVDITDIPAGVSRVVIQLDGVSQNAANTELLLQIGDSGGIETAGYNSTILQTVATINIQQTTVGFQLTDVVSYDAATAIDMKIDLVHMGSDVWIASYIGNDDASSLLWHGNGQRSALDSALTQTRLTTVAGTATFDLGTMRLVAVL